MLTQQEQQKSIQTATVNAQIAKAEAEAIKAKGIAEAEVIQ